MPQHKQPALLRDMASDVLIEYGVQCCLRHSNENSLERLSECITFMKENVCTCIPPQFLTNFCNTFFDRFGGHRHRDDHGNIVMEILMDLGVTEIGLVSSVVCPFIAANRFQGLKKLGIYENSHFRQSLENFPLPDITSLEFTADITDSDLKVVGENFPNLRELTIDAASELTDKGLQYLSGCPELRSFQIEYCPKICYGAFHELLASHKKMQKLVKSPIDRRFLVEDFEQFFTLPGVYPSIDHLGVQVSQVDSSHLRSMVMQFPNLRTLEIDGYIEGDMSILKSLGHLSVLDFSGVSRFPWCRLKELLKFIGANISVINLGCSFDTYCGMTQDDLNYAFEVCKNIEVFNCNWLPDFDGQTLIIPPFPQLQRLHCVCGDRSEVHEIEFKTLSHLESLSIDAFHYSTESIESIIFDATTFPVLKCLSMCVYESDWDVEQIRRTVKDNNLALDVYISQQW